MDARSRIAVYTTVHPSTLPYLREWHAAMRAQSHKDFDLWIGVDQVTSEALNRSLDKPLDARLIASQPGDTPAQLRERAIENLIQHYESIVFVDSDDVPAAERLERAVFALAQADIACCALELIDAKGRSLGGRFAPSGLDSGIQPIREEWLLHGNVVGLGNSAFRSECLRRCLPIPDASLAVDWLLATRAWLQGARLVFDAESGGFYRRHAACVTPIRPPFTLAAVKAATQVVLDHHAAVTRQNGTYMKDRKAAWDNRRRAVADFAEWLYSSDAEAAVYICALNALPAVHTWWSCVAHPALEKIWLRA